MISTVKCLFFISILFPAITFSQANYDYEKIQRKRIKTVTAYRLLHFYSKDSLSPDTEFVSYQYNRKGCIVSMHKVLKVGKDTLEENIKNYNDDGIALYQLERGRDCRKCAWDTSCYSIIKLGSDKKATYCMTVIWDMSEFHGIERSDERLEAVMGDTTISFPASIVGYSLNIPVGVKYIYVNRDFIYYLKNDTLFYGANSGLYCRNAWYYGPPCKGWPLTDSTYYFMVTEKSDSGFWGRTYVVRHDSVFYDGVHYFHCTYDSLNGLVHEATLSYDFRQKREQLYDPSKPRAENIMAGQFVPDPSYDNPKDPFFAVINYFFYSGLLDENGQLQPKIELQDGFWPAFTQPYAEDDLILESLKRSYPHFKIERYTSDFFH